MIGTYTEWFEPPGPPSRTGIFDSGVSFFGWRGHGKLEEASSHHCHCYWTTHRTHPKTVFAGDNPHCFPAWTSSKRDEPAFWDLCSAPEISERNGRIAKVSNCWSQWWLARLLSRPKTTQRRPDGQTIQLNSLQEIRERGKENMNINHKNEIKWK